MNQPRHQYVIALLIVSAAVTAAVIILTIPAFFDRQEEPSVGITVALGCVFLALVAVATRQRRKHLPWAR